MIYAGTTRAIKKPGSAYYLIIGTSCIRRFYIRISSDKTDKLSTAKLTIKAY